MDKLQRQVRQMHIEILNQPHSPAEPQIRTPELRARLIAEEAIETVCALVGGRAGQNIVHELLAKVLQDRAKNKMSGPDLKEAIDGCIDTLVVTYGTLEAIGVDGEPFADEVMRSNMAKKGGPVDAYGKIGKPEGWTPPDIAGVLANTSPPVRESCGCDGALDDGCYNCTALWRCPMCCFPLALVAGHKFCAHCAKQKLTTDEWRDVASTGRFTEEQMKRFGLVSTEEVHS